MIVAASDEQRALDALAKNTTTLSPATRNAFLLATVARVRLRWVDSLACHLELAVDSNALFLFRFPAFCVATLAISTSTPTARTTMAGTAGTAATAVAVANAKPDADTGASKMATLLALLSDTHLIFACAAPQAGMQWAMADNMRRLLHTTLLSYRLFFGQSAAARKLSRTKVTDPFPTYASPTPSTCRCHRESMLRCRHQALLPPAPRRTSPLSNRR
jgi:hypothetical protein